MNQLRIDYLPLDGLVPYERNAKLHPQEQVEKIANSIREFGFNAPIMLDDRNGIIAGHGRAMAAKLLGIKQVPCVYLSHLSDVQKRAYILADNRTAQSDWSVDLLSLELKDLQFEDFDLSLTGFDPGELEMYLTDPEPPEEEGEKPFDEPEGEPISILGDIWQCGPHRIGCGDAADSTFIETLLDRSPVDLVYCDPPYGIGEAAGRNKSRGKIAKAKDYGNDDWDNQIPYAAIQTALSLSKNVVLWGGNYFADKLPPSSCWLVWDKENGANDFADCELAWTSYPSAVRMFRFRWAGMLQGDMKNKEDRVHPTQKPVALHKWAFETLKAGGVVVDLFGGSGSSLIACEKTGRACFTCDITPKYVDAMVRRWQDVAGTHAVHAETGDVFPG
jgi:hypothetical protein